MMLTCDCEGCDKSIPEYGAIVLTIDGDMACSEACAKKWRKDMDHFVTNILPNDKEYARWWREAGVDIEGAL